MNRKILTIILGIFVVIMIGVVLYFMGGKFIWSEKQQNQNKTKVPPVEQPTGKTNNFENSQLVEIAKHYVLKKAATLLEQRKIC